MKKRIVYAIIAVAVLSATLFSWLNWDVIFSEAQNLYYSVKYSSERSTSGSTVEEGSIRSAYLKGAVKKFRIYLPPSYYRNAQLRFPVVYLLHGYPGTDRDWLTNTNLQKRLDDKIKKGSVPPVIVVFPDMNGPLVRDGQYIDAVRIDQNMESYFVSELVPFIDSRYRTQAKRGKRALGGLSSGGWGALYLGIKHSNMFSYVFSHSGYMINRETAMNILVGKKAALRQRFDIFAVIREHEPIRPFFLYADIGKNDSTDFRKDNEKFDAFLSGMDVDHIFRITPGGHGWSVWSKNIDNSLAFLRAVFSDRIK